jgi:anaerobic dimethyl sulfoxide reductase subunit A
MTHQASPLASLGGTVTRRKVLKWTGVAGGAAVLGGAGSRLGLVPLAAAHEGSPAAKASKVVWSACIVNCGGRCPLRLNVVDGAIVRVDAEDTGDDKLGTQQIRACPRGRAIRKRIYNPDRLKYPMKRVGKRGSGDFKRISWDEAFDEIATKLKSTIEVHGNESVWINYGTGTLGGTVTCSWPNSSSVLARLMNCVGGFLDQYGDYSAANIEAAYPYYYGGWTDSNSFDDAVNSKLVVLWGNNPAETRMSGGGQTFVLEEAKKEGGAKIVLVDPRYSDTAVTMVDQWVPLRPGSDPALVAGLAHVMITENLHDQAFLDKYCVGFDEEHMPEGVPAGNSYKSYVLGAGPDATPKTPEWASKISGVPAATIVTLAREMAQAKPCMVTQGWGPQRHSNGDVTARAVFTLAVMTGNIGIPGGGTGGREGSYSLPTAVFPTLTNPVTTTISMFSWTEAVERGAEMTALADGVLGKDKLDTPIKFIWQYAGNALVNQHADTNRTAKLLEDDSKCEMIVVIDNQMTVSARYADIVLPDVSNAEQYDLANQQGAGNLGYVISMSKAIEPLFETKTIYEMGTELAKRLGVERQFTEGKSQDDWLREIYAGMRKLEPDLPDFDALREMGIWKKKNPDGHVVPLKEFRDDPHANALATPSGKIEIFSEQLWKLNQTWEIPEGQKICAIPEFTLTREGPTDPLRKTYPLQCIGHHYKARTHSTYGNVSWLKEAHPQAVWINTLDAQRRDIKDGDSVHVFNKRGRLEVAAKVTPRIAPGVVSVPQGAWYSPDASTGIDKGGCTNTLTSWDPTVLAKANGQHSNLVQVEKA